MKRDKLQEKLQCKAAQPSCSSVLSVWPVWQLFVWSSEPKASSVFTLLWHVWQKLVNSNYPTLAEHDCWINKNTSCWADEPWMLIWCLEVLQSPIPWQQPMEINCPWVGINSSPFLCRGIDGFWCKHTWCRLQLQAFTFQNYPFRVLSGTGKHISGSLVERKKNCCNEFKRWKKSKRDLTN